MTLDELHKKLQATGVPSDWYYLHGLYGSTDDNNKLALTIKKGKYTIEYEVYFRERGEKHSTMTFNDEDKACDYLFKHIKNNWTLEQIQKIEGLGGMTVNERLFASGLMNEFDDCKTKDKTRAKEILRWLRVDEPSIEKIIK